MNDNYVVNEGSLPPKKKKLYWSFSCFFILFIIIGTILYPLKKISPKKVFTAAIETVYSATTRNVSDSNFSGANITLQTNLISSEEEQARILTLLNHFTLQMQYGVSFEKQKAYVDFNSQYKSKNLLSFQMHFEKEKAYIFLKELYSKYLEVPINEFKTKFSTKRNTEDMQIVLDYIKDALQKSLKDKYFKKENTTLLLDQKRVKVTRNQLILNQENGKEIYITLGQELDNDYFISSLSKLLNKSKEQIKSIINKMKKGQISLSQDDELVFSIYTKGLKNNFIGIAIENKEDSFIILKNKNTHYDFSLKIKNETSSGSLDILKNEENYRFQITLNTKQTKGTITVECNFNKENIPSIDTSNTVFINDLTEKEKIDIINKLQNQEGIQELMQEIVSLYTTHMKI